MSLKVPDNFGQVLANISVVGDPSPFAVTWGVDSSTESDMDEFVGEIGAAFRTNLKSLLNSAFSLGPTTLRVNRSGSDDGELSVFVDPTVDAGTSATTARLPQNCAYLIHKRTAVGGRHGRGRMYWPSPSEAAVDNVGVVDSATVTSLQTSFAAFLAAFNTSGGPIESGLWLLHNDIGATTPPPTRVSTLQVDHVIATQRRRLRK